MAEGKDPEFAELEQSLIHFLCDKPETEKFVAGGAKRVRGLSFGIELKDPKKPCFTVQIGMCEAGFNAFTGLKEKGSCFGLERFVRDWYDRPSVKHAIKGYIKAHTKD